MSARFGRNKRRRAREEIEQLRERNDNLEVAHQMDRGLLTYQSKKLREVDDELLTAKLVAAPFSTMFAPQPFSVACDEQEQVLMDEPVRYEPVDIGDMSAGDSMRFYSIPLDVLISSVDKDLMRRQVHCIVKFANARSAYAISSDALRRMGKDVLLKTLRDNIARQLARDLVAQLKR